MIIAEYTLDHPILRHTRTTLSECEIRVEDAYISADGRRQFIARFDHDDFEAVDAALGSDPTVQDPEVLDETPDHRLYRLALVGRGAETDIMPLLIEVGGVHLELVATGEGWKNRTRFPDREAFERVYRFCVDHDVEFTFDRIWEETGEGTDVSRPLTDVQRETLVAAIECGYLEIPRQCTLAELAARLDISDSAASERFRRAVKKLVNRTVYS